jgi:glycosyltransferase involved in cell wall biosynthesis
MRLLHDRHLPVRLHLTLDENTPGVAELLSVARRLGVAKAIVNHGELDSAGISGVYREAHICVFPSVCESFGFPQVEAMASGLPLIAADTTVNREVCADGAVYFPPHDAGRLAELVAHFCLHPADLVHAANAGLARAVVFDWRRAARETLSWLGADTMEAQVGPCGSPARSAVGP